MTRKAKNTVTYEILRKDAKWMAEFIAMMADDTVNGVFSQYTIGVPEHKRLRELAKMLHGATRIVIHDTDQLPED